MSKWYSVSCQVFFSIWGVTEETASAVHTWNSFRLAASICNMFLYITLKEEVHRGYTGELKRP
jgi:hypothetical protein